MAVRKARDNPELREHLVITQALHWWQHEDFWWAHYPSGEHRHGADAAKLKCMGVRAGVADFMFLRKDWNGRIVFTEYKPEKGRLSKAQKDFQALCKDFGIAYRVCHGKEQMCRQLRLVGAFDPDHEREAVESILAHDSVHELVRSRRAA
ncbi:MAG: VRR-NUC domain-containing protein [bacterium]